MDYEVFEEKTLEGFGTGAVAFAVLEAVATIGATGATSSTTTAAFLGPIGWVFLVGLSILGIVTGLGKGRATKPA